jgi:hypothetical protein
MHRQAVFWLSDQPEEVSLPTEGLYKPPAVAAFALTSSVPDYSGGTAPDSHRVPDCLGGWLIKRINNMGRISCQGSGIRENCRFRLYPRRRR